MPSPIRRVLVLLNAKAGTLAGLDDTQEACRIIRSGFGDAGIEARIQFVEADELAAVCAASLQGQFDVILAGGGDGTANTIANALAGSGTALGVLPLGTFNHAAQELNVPLELEEAIRALARGSVVHLPISEVNGRVFLNFSSLGLHPEIVRHRDAQRKALGRSKMLAMLIAAWRALWRFPLMRVRISADGGPAFRRLTPSVVIGNNASQLRALGLAGGEYQNRSVLKLFVARTRGRWGMTWLWIRAMFGFIEGAEHFEVLGARRFTIDNFRSHVRVTIDGEVTDLVPPLEYRVRPEPLKVLRPEAR